MTRIVLFLFIIAAVAAVVLGVALVLRASRRPKPVSDDPREILRRRYAAGEIDEDEYLRRMSGLSQDW
ncbi:SHOCT domain-containing protein [Streptosporangium sp. NBC_01756]|uniref:SHOCT domain-containing protein n=1 Tax=Streptosporangium sp. NBC_01756 TaxID=2975950 RepID=UPI002DDA5052|nr:SHOCT domain-containing protein [Streptosporangium sp. NBC_01756]WSC88241.1 SHOCT domain-containing protein [Streptosporangium sp. NBC_01756]